MQFFVLERERAGSDHETTFLPSEPHRMGDALRCPACGQAYTNRPWLPPRYIELQVYGKDFGTFADISAHGIVVSEHGRDVMQREEVTGVGPYEAITVVKVKGRSVRAKTTPRYFFTQVERGGARVDKAKSGATPGIGRPCDACLKPSPKTMDRLVLEEGSWTGLDVFMAWGLFGRVIVTERFAEIATRADFTNMKLTPAEEFKITYP